MDDYVYAGDDDVIGGEEEIEEGEVFKVKDFNKRIIIEGKERD